MDPQILYDIFAKTNRLINEGRDIIKLNVGEPEQQPPSSVSQIIKDSIDRGRVTYGPNAGDYTLRKLIATSHRVKPENVIIGPGSKFLIYASLKLLSQENKNTSVLIPLPAWSAFALMLKDLGLTKINYINTQEENDWKITPGDLKKHLQDSQVMIITSPNNPTSTKISRQDYSSLKKISQKNQITIIKDCAYQDLMFTPQEEKTDLNGIIEVHSFSKKFCMTGFRIGYLLAHEEIINRLTNYMQITISSVPLFIQDAAIHLLNNSPDFPRKIAKIYKKRAQKAGEILKNAGVTFVAPSAGFYIFANLKRPTSKLCLELIERGVSLVPGTAFGPYPNYVRISLTEEDHRLERGVKMMLDNLDIQ